MNTIINLPYQIGKGFWIIRNVFYVAGFEKIYIRKNDTYEEYQEKPIWESKWIKEFKYLKSYEITEDIQFCFSTNKWLDNDEGSDINVYDSEVYIFETEQEADLKLKELQ